jgi:hypothetical protein
VTNQNLTFYFHACGDTQKLPPFGPEVTNDCRDGYSLCMLNSTLAVNQTSQTAKVLGKFAELDFKQNQLMFPENNKIATITLQCTPYSDENVFYAPQNIEADQIVRSPILRST